MKFLKMACVFVVGLIAMNFALVYAASELGGEVVTLIRANEDGSSSRVRVWIVDQNGRSWIDHGGSDAYWVRHLTQDDSIRLERNNEVRHYTAVADKSACSLYDELRRQKYGWADQLIDTMTGVDSSNCAEVPVRLELAQ